MSSISLGSSLANGIAGVFFVTAVVGTLGPLVIGREAEKPKSPELSTARPERPSFNFQGKKYTCDITRGQVLVCSPG
jgi:hypothetical protein